MAADRDLNVAVVRAWGVDGARPRLGWEMLAATGVRGLRVLHEAGGFERLDQTEGHPAGFEALVRNAALHPGAQTHRWDARGPLAADAYHYVDLDPYGSPLEFLDAALAAAAPGALIAVTATDMRVLGGADVLSARRRYGGNPVRGRLGPEGGLRLLLAEIARRAAARRYAIEPRLAYVGDHHVRAYVSVRTSGADEGAGPIGALDASTWDGPPVGAGGPFGPMWLGPLFDPELIESLVVPPGAARPREVAQLIERFQGEARIHRPFFYESNTLARELGLGAPPRVDALIREIERGSHRAARSHVRDGAIRTEAPHAAVVAAARAIAQSQNDRVRA